MPSAWLEFETITLGENGLGKHQFLPSANLGLGASLTTVASYRLITPSLSVSSGRWESDAYLGGVVPIKLEKHVQSASPVPGM